MESCKANGLQFFNLTIEIYVVANLYLFQAFQKCS